MTKSRDIDYPTRPQDDNPGGGMRSSGSGAVHGGEAARPNQSSHDEKKSPAPDTVPDKESK